MIEAGVGFRLLMLFQGAYFKLMQVALLQLLGSVYLAIIEASMGSRLETLLAVALLQLLAAVFLAMNEAVVGFRLDIFPARYNLDTIPRRLFQTDAVGTTAATSRSLFGDNFRWRGFQDGHLLCPLRF
jgi:hypothetical protein